LVDALATVIGTTTEHVTRFADRPVLTVIQKADEKAATKRDEAAVTV